MVGLPGEFFLCYKAPCAFMDFARPEISSLPRIQGSFNLDGFPRPDVFHGRRQQARYIHANHQGR